MIKSKNIVVLLTLGKSKNIVVLLTLGKSKKLSFCQLWASHLDGCFLDGCHFADFGQIKKDCHFAEFEQVNVLLDKTPFGETGCLSNFLGSLSMSPALHPGFSDLSRSPPALSSTPTTFGWPLFLMFRHPVF